jgi:hypothetical protein
MDRPRIPVRLPLRRERSASLVFTTSTSLTRTVSGQGSVSGADGFCLAASAVSLTATPATGYQFAGWSGGASGTANPLSLTMSGPWRSRRRSTPAPVAVRSKPIPLRLSTFRVRVV